MMKTINKRFKILLKRIQTISTTSTLTTMDIKTPTKEMTGSIIPKQDRTDNKMPTKEMTDSIVPRKTIIDNMMPTKEMTGSIIPRKTIMDNMI